MEVMGPVLLIDDDPVSISITDAVVRGINSKWETVQIASATEGLAYMQNTETPPLFAILDLRMPDMDAFELLDACAKRIGTLSYPVFLLSAYVSAEVAERAAGVPFIRCVFPKPLHPGSLMYHLVMNGIRTG